MTRHQVGPNNHVADPQESARLHADHGPSVAAVEDRPYQPHPAPALMWRFVRQDWLTRVRDYYRGADHGNKAFGELACWRWAMTFWALVLLVVAGAVAAVVAW